MIASKDSIGMKSALVWEYNHISRSVLMNLLGLEKRAQEAFGLYTEQNDAHDVGQVVQASDR